MLFRVAYNCLYMSQTVILPSTDADYFNGLIDYVIRNKEFPLVWDYGRAYLFLAANGLLNEPDSLVRLLRSDARQQVDDEIFLSKAKGYFKIEMTTDNYLTSKFKEVYVKFKIEKTINQQKNKMSENEKKEIGGGIRFILEALTLISKEEGNKGKIK